MRRKTKKLYIFTLLTAIMLTFSESLAPGEVSFAQVDAEGYVYDSWGDVQSVPAAFEVERILDQASLKENGEFDGFTTVDDVSTSEDGRLFVCDKGGKRIYVFDKDGNCVKSIKNFRDAKTGKLALRGNSEQILLTSPTGTYYHEKNQELYIADAMNKEIYVLDGKTYELKKMYTKPENMIGDADFAPSKITVDYADRVYAIVSSSHEGIIELNSDGSFSRYFGVNEPVINYIEQFWKSLATDVQKEKMGRTYAPAFTNVVTDNEGFVYAVTDDMSAGDYIFRLNSSGQNVIREEGLKLKGDFTEKGSKFIDIAVTDYGVYAVLDKEEGRIFLYDYDGQILNIFGGKGITKDKFQNPTSIDWFGNKLVVTDSDLKEIYIFSPTDFGDVALRASEQYYWGNWEEATELFKECVRLNSNYEVAYIGLGKNCLMQDNYKDAMYYFKLGNAKTYYSKAYEGYRGEQIKKHFWIVAIVFVGLIAWLIESEVKYRKNNPV